MPRCRPGHACGPAPNGSQAPGRWTPLCHRSGRNAGQALGVPGHEVGQAPEKQRADQHDGARRDSWPPRSTSRVVTRAVTHVGASGAGSPRPLHGSIPSDPRPDGVLGRATPEPRACSDGDLDAGGRASWLASGASASRSAKAATRPRARRARRAPHDVRGSTDAGRRAAMTGPAHRSRRARGRRRGRVGRPSRREARQRSWIARRGDAAGAWRRTARLGAWRRARSVRRFPLAWRRWPTPRATCSGPTGRRVVAGTGVPPAARQVAARGLTLPGSRRRPDVGEHLPGLVGWWRQPWSAGTERDHRGPWCDREQRRAGHRPTRHCPCASHAWVAARRPQRRRGPDARRTRTGSARRLRLASMAVRMRFIMVFSRGGGVEHAGRRAG